MAFFIFLKLARMVFLNKDGALDKSVSAVMEGYINPTNTLAMQSFSFMGAHYFLIPANLLLVLYFLFIKKHTWHSIKIPSIALSSLLLMLLLKQIFHRQRPSTPLLEAARGMSFPSGHAMLSISFYGLLICLVWEYVKKPVLKWFLVLVLLLLILIIGASRIYLQVHYASDVLAGYCLGLMWLIICLWTLNSLEKFSQRNGDAIVENKPASI